MIRFIIVENDVVTQKNIKDIVTKVAFSFGDYNIETYNCFNDKLLNTIEDNSIRKIYLIDIELDNCVSGIQIAKKIREDDWESHIIFLTNHDKLFESAHRSVFEVFSFIEKFHDMENRLKKDLKKILSQKFDNKLFKYETSKVTLQLYLHDITYIYRDKEERKLIIHTTKGCSFKVKLTLKEIQEKLDDRFRQVHRACIVNTERVCKYDWVKGKFILDNKEAVDLLSKKFKNEVITA